MKKRKTRKKRVKTCDYGHETTGAVRRLSLGGGAGINLCRTHWAKDMAWRRQRNKQLARRGTLSKSSRYPIRKFPG